MSKKGTGGKEEEVVKVKLNTGTLYLYKGLHRRAVFVRRVWREQSYIYHHFSTFDRK
jgi:hypothetical protein